MTEVISSYYKSLKGKKIFFLGAGISHKDLIIKFAKLGADVTLCDRKDYKSLGEYGNEIKSLGVNFILGEHYLSKLLEADIVFRTPGIDYTKPEIQKAVKAGIKVTSEIETFFDLCPCKIVGITGSDGKTTSTSLIASILKNGGYNVYLGGNIGTPLLPLVDDMKETDIAVVELSSFQLISMKKSPDISLVTNVTPNHLDHHKDMNEYIDAKRNILLHQDENSVSVLFADNDITNAMKDDVKGELRLFSRKQVSNGAFLKDNCLYTVKNGEQKKLMELCELKLRGEHNKDNICGAAAVVMGMVSDEVLVDSIKEFSGVEHRIEFVRELDGVKWYNDSIATSPTRMIAGLRSFDQKLIVIAGGSDKGVSFEPLAPEIIEHVKTIILCGATAKRIQEVLKSHKDFEKSGLEIVITNDIPEAVVVAKDKAKQGDVVTLSPACPSFDSYPNFEYRGRHFKQLVNDLK